MGLPEGQGKSGLRGDIQLGRALQKGPWEAVNSQESAGHPDVGVEEEITGNLAPDSHSCTNYPRIALPLIGHS